MTPKYIQVADVLERRIRHGDYLLKELPSGRVLAEEMGVSHIVIRSATDLLVKEGWLERQPNGRFSARMANDSAVRTQARIAFLAPAFDSPFFGLCRVAVEHVARELGAYLRHVDYIHYDDAVIADVLDAFDGVYVVPMAQAIPRTVAQRFVQARSRVASFDHDLTEHGIPCIDIFPIDHLPALFDHLAGLGRSRIGCFNVQPEDPVNRRRIQAWRAWLQDRGLAGQLIDEPVHLYDRAIGHAHEVTGRLLRDGGLECDALFVTTTNAAKGVVRALWDAGVAIGRDFLVASVGDEGDARYMTPSLTTLEPPDLPRLVRQTMTWMLDPGKAWSGALVVGEDAPRLFVGETTRPRSGSGSKAMANP